MRVSMIVVVFFCVRTRRLRRISPPFPTRFRPRQYRYEGWAANVDLTSDFRLQTSETYI